MVKDDVWLFVVHNKGLTWTRARVPVGVDSVNAMLSYLRRGGPIVPISDGLEDFPERPRFTPAVIGMTVLARLSE